MALPPIPAGVEQGDHNADLDAWLRTYGPGLQAFFAKKVGPHEAEDLVHEVFLHLQTRAVAEQVENVERYLFKIAHNVLADQRRSRAVRRSRFQVPLDQAGDPSDPLSPERVVIGKAEYARVVVAIRKLPPRTQTAFLLHRFRQMTYVTIARRMGISVSAVKQLMARALAQITDDLERTS